MELNKLIKKKSSLDEFRPLPPALVRNLEEWFRIELTYTSNAVECSLDIYLKALNEVINT